MYAVVGTLCIALAVLGFTVVVLAARRPRPPAWTRYTLTHELVTMSAVALVGFGIASVVQSIGLVRQQPPTAMQVMLIASIVVVFAVAWKLLRVEATLAEYARETESATQPAEPIAQPGFVPSIAETSSGSEPTTPEDPSSPTRPRTPHLPKKAA